MEDLNENDPNYKYIQINCNNDDGYRGSYQDEYETETYTQKIYFIFDYPDNINDCNLDNSTINYQINSIESSSISKDKDNKCNYKVFCLNTKSKSFPQKLNFDINCDDIKYEENLKISNSNKIIFLFDIEIKEKTKKLMFFNSSKEKF